MKFEVWFRKQFGPDPCPDLHAARCEANDLRYRLIAVEQVIDNKERWETSKKAAKYAWNLQDKEKGKVE